ncbi:MAG: serine protease [Lachnospiraceae bacterium]|nr:serine protease [Lachnospiraceae bacterium]
MKRKVRESIIFRLFATAMLVFAICITSIAAGDAVFAHAAGRLKSSASKLWLNGEGKFTITFKNRAIGEDVTIKAKKSGYVDIVKGEWDGDICTVTLTPLKDKNTTLTIASGSESIKVKLFMRREKVMSGEDIYAYARSAMVEIKTIDSAGSVYIGSGFFIGNGLVISNEHVIAAASSITITDYNGKTYPIKEISGCDAIKDLVVIKVSGSTPGALTLAKKAIGGERVYCIGSPAGLTGTFITGLVANEGYLIKGVYYNQLSLPTGVGMGGGPIINSKGQVLGIMTLYVNAAQNITMAVDCSEISAFLDSLTKDHIISLEEYYKTTIGKTKESNDYKIFDGFSDKNTTLTGLDIPEALTPEEIFKQARDAVVDIVIIYNEKGSMVTGSGFFTDENTIITNNHVMDVPKVYQMVISDYLGNTYLLESMKTDPDHDVAVLTVSLDEAAVDEVTGESKPHGVLTLAKGYIPAVGEEVYGMGSPAGYSCTFSEGIVSMSGRFLDGITFVNHTVPITQGSSGGPLLNRYGQVIAINSRVINIISNSNLSVLIEYIDLAE